MIDPEKDYEDQPFIPFWEKERLLRAMHPKDAERIAEKDVFLPKFVKDKFSNDEDS